MWRPLPLEASVSRVAAVLYCVVVCCSVLQLHTSNLILKLQYSVLQLCCCMLQCIACAATAHFQRHTEASVFRVAIVLQYVAVCCSVLQPHTPYRSFSILAIVLSRSLSHTHSLAHTKHNCLSLSLSLSLLLFITHSHFLSFFFLTHRAWRPLPLEMLAEVMQLLSDDDAPVRLEAVRLLGLLAQDHPVPYDAGMFEFRAHFIHSNTH